MEKCLVIVDFQKDFYDKENGSLYVNGAEDKVNVICNAIKSNDYKYVICTLDWHGEDDESFACNGGIWPVHCVKENDGASIHNDILAAISESESNAQYFKKGDCKDHEEYGAFESCEASNGITLYNFSKKSSVSFESNDIEFTICGLAGDYCVWETYKNLKSFGFNVTPLYEGMAFIGDTFDYEDRLKNDNQ